jgi:hypothetical protein
VARDHARIMLSIWEDDEFRALTPGAQHLYLVLTIHPELNYAGVADWRPARLAGFAAGWTASDVELAGKELADHLYILIDEDTEEVLLRSFIRNDGLLNQPNLAVSVRKAHTSVASANLRQVIVHELNRLKIDKPDLKGWDRIDDLLTKPSLDPSDHPSFHPSIDPSFDPSVRGQSNPSDDPSIDPSSTTAPAPTPSPTPPTGRTVARGTRLSPDWRLDASTTAWTLERLSQQAASLELEKFRNHWTAKTGRDATKLDWSATWRNWVLNSRSAQTGHPPPPQSTADQRVNQGAALAAELRQEQTHTTRKELEP